MSPESPAYVAIRFATLTGVTLVLGALVFRAIVLRRAMRDGMASDVADIAYAGATRVGALGIAMLLAAAPLRLAAQYATLGIEGPVDREMLAMVITATTWGKGWLLHVVAIALGIWVLSRRWPGPSALQTLIAAMPLAIFPALSGHPAAASNFWLEIALDALHVTGAGAWVGGLAALAIAGIPAALGAGSAARGTATLALLRAFSPVALTAFSTLALTGLVVSWIRVGGFAALRDTPYGHSLLLKVALVAVLVMIGALNWRRLGPAAGSERGAAALREAMVWELAFGIAVLVVTAVLVARPPPME